MWEKRERVGVFVRAGEGERESGCSERGCKRGKKERWRGWKLDVFCVRVCMGVGEVGRGCRGHSCSGKRIY